MSYQPFGLSKHSRDGLVLGRALGTDDGFGVGLRLGFDDNAIVGLTE